MRGQAEHGGNRAYFGQDRIEAAPASAIHRELKRIATLRRESPALQRGLQLPVELSGDRAVFYRVYQHDGTAQTALVLLNKGDAPQDFAIERMLQAGTWRSALEGGEIEVARGGKLEASVPAHGVQVFLLDAAVSDPALKAALDTAMAGARRAQ